jgi:hypothetical protein
MRRDSKFFFCQEIRDRRYSFQVSREQSTLTRFGIEKTPLDILVELA